MCTHTEVLRRTVAAVLVAVSNLAYAVGEEPNQQSSIEPIGVEEPAGGSFWKDSALILKPRSYLLVRDRDTAQDNVGWALGGALEYKSGWLLDQLQINATLFTSQKLYGPSDKDGTLLFKPGPEQITVLGEANVTWRFADQHGVRVGRQRFELPYLGSHDIRMIPNTFEAIAVGNKVSHGLGYIAGYVNRIKRKNDDEFIAMSRAAGAANSDEGVGFAGALYTFEGGTRIGGIYQRTFDAFDTLFAKVEHPFKFSNFEIGGFLQYTDQRSTGDELIGNFDTNMVAAKLELKHGDYKWRIGASSTSDNAGIQKPYGNPANYLSVIVEDFDRAGEKAWLIGMSYDFKRVGVGDSSMFANIVRGNTPDRGANASPDETEYDLTFDYRVKEGWAKRVWLRTRLAYVDKDDAAGGDDFWDFRIIVNYDFDLLK